MSPTGLWKGRVLPSGQDRVLPQVERVMKEGRALSHGERTNQKGIKVVVKGDDMEEKGRTAREGREEKGSTAREGRVGTFKFIYVRVCSRMDEVPDEWSLGRIRYSPFHNSLSFCSVRVHRKTVRNYETDITTISKVG